MTAAAVGVGDGVVDADLVVVGDGVVPVVGAVAVVFVACCR